MLEVLGEVDAVVGRPRLLAERDDLVVAVGVELDEALAEAMAHHAVADDHDRLLSLASHGGRLRWVRAHRKRPGRASSAPAPCGRGEQCAKWLWDKEKKWHAGSSAAYLNLRRSGPALMHAMQALRAGQGIERARAHARGRM